MQAASGFLGQLDGIPDLTASPFHFGLIGSSLRERFHHDGIFVVSLVSSPGAGKTAFLEKTSDDPAPKSPSGGASWRSGHRQ
jgi:hypothetical protein